MNTDSSHHELPRGTVIGGRYEILRKIGEGGMCLVYLVMDLNLKVNWALKEVRRDGVKDYEVIHQGLIVETDMLKKLSHTHLPRIVDVIDDDGVFYIVMDYIPGKTLKEILDEYGAQEQEQVIDWAQQLSGVLQYLHSQNPPIIYRDMKPGNVMLNPQGELILFDFGIAREFKESNVADTVCLGTLGYAAPEQFGGHGQTDPRTDIYCLGATIYHLVTGKNPSEPPYEILPIRQVNPLLSAGLEKIILKCTEKDPDKRYQDCFELIYALQHFNEIDEEYKKKQKRKLTAFLVPFTAAILSLGFTVFSYAGMRNAQRSNYQDMLNKANDMATQSIYQGEYSQEVLDQFTQTIDIDPSREDAYSRLLDYCVGVGNTEAGLNAVCTRIDSGTGNIDKSSGLLLDVARLYFGGTAKDPEFTGDYTKAAKYFAMINEKDVPEAAYYSSLSVALGSFSSKVDWNEVSKTLEDFRDYNEGQTLSIDRIRNDQLTAGVYTANKREFSNIGIDPYAQAIDLLNRALEGIKELEKDVGTGVSADTSLQELPDLHTQVLEDLAAAYSTAYTINSPAQDFDKALDCYAELKELIDDAERLKNIYFKTAEVTILQGDEKSIENAYQELIRKYPDSASSYMGYAMYLYDRENLEESAAYYRKARACSDAGEDPNLEKLGIKLKNAGVLKEGE